MFARLRSFALGSLFGFALLAPLSAARADEEPLPRFEDALCPGVVGLRRDAAEAMVGRMRANAEMLGLRMADSGDCEANFIVAFVADGQSFLSGLEDRSSYVFAEMSHDERTALMAEPGPARALLRVRTRSRDGMPISRRENLTDIPQATMWMAHSKIYTATRNDILSALVLFDRDEIRQLTLDQLADYATFRALVHQPPDPSAHEQGSILSLFDSGGTPPAGLTAFDRAYLARLYTGMANLPAQAKLADLARATGVDAVE